MKSYWLRIDHYRNLNFSSCRTSFLLQLYRMVQRMYAHEDWYGYESYDKDRWEEIKRQIRGCLNAREHVYNKVESRIIRRLQAQHRLTKPEALAYVKQHRINMKVMPF